MKEQIEKIGEVKLLQGYCNVTGRAWPIEALQAPRSVYVLNCKGSKTDKLGTILISPFAHHNHGREPRTSIHAFGSVLHELAHDFVGHGVRQRLQQELEGPWANRSHVDTILKRSERTGELYVEVVSLRVAQQFMTPLEISLWDTLHRGHPGVKDFMKSLTPEEIDWIAHL